MKQIYDAEGNPIDIILPNDKMSILQDMIENMGLVIKSQYNNNPLSNSI